MKLERIIITLLLALSAGLFYKAFIEKTEVAVSEEYSEDIREEIFADEPTAQAKETNVTTTVKPKINASEKKSMVYKFEKLYETELPIRYFSNLMDSEISESEFKKEIRYLQTQTNNSEFTPNGEIDVSDLPQNQTAYKEWFGKLEQIGQQKLLQVITQENIDFPKTALILQSLQHLKIISMLEFHGYTKEGQLQLKFPRDLIAKKTKLKRTTASENPSKGLFSLNNLDYEKLTEAQQKSLTHLKENQTNYEEPLSGHEERSRLNNQGDFLDDSTYKIVDTIVDGTSTFFKFTNQDYHDSNIKIINESIETAHKYPALFGLKNSNVEPNSKNLDVTSFSFPLLLPRIIAGRSAKAATFSGFSSVLFGDTAIAGIVSKATLFLGKGKFGQIAMESVIIVYNLYAGLRQAHILHRYYSYMLGVKKSQGDDFDPDKAKIQFLPNKILFTRNLNKDLYRSWLTGLVTGLGIQKFETVNLFQILEKELDKSGTNGEQQAQL